MSKATDEFKELMESDRGERAYYLSMDRNQTFRVPITRDGFEALLERACAYMSLPITNPLRNVLVGFLHHLENTVHETTLVAVGAALHKSMSNNCTYIIDQEIKAAANKELREEQEKLAAAAAELQKAEIDKKKQEKKARLDGYKQKAIDKRAKKEMKEAQLNGQA